MAPALVAALAVTVAAAAVGGLAVTAHAQSAAIHYVYDELNRLVGVVDQQGHAATYVYDAVGNLLRIDRVDAAGTVAVTLVAPNRGKAGTLVEIFGKGFSTVPAQNTVTFNGTPAAVSAAAPNRLLTSVPPGATTGHIAVTTPLGSAQSPSVFRVPGDLTVSPPSASVLANGTQQFQALEDGVPTTLVRWTVNGIPGGETSIGTISTAGLYQAPAVAPPPSVTIEAVAVEDPSVAASASVTIVPPMPAFLGAGSVSVAVAGPALAVVDNVVAHVSVRIAEPFVVDRSLVGSASVRVEPADHFAAGGLVSVAREPVVTAVAPATAFPGTNISISVTGSGLGTISSIVFLLNNAADSTIVAGNLAVNGAGTEVTADITVDGSAPLGARVVQVVTAEGSSTVTATVGNVFTVE